MICGSPIQCRCFADLPIDGERIRPCDGVQKAVGGVGCFDIFRDGRGHRQHMILPSLFAGVDRSAEVVSVELDQVLLLGIVADEIFGEITGRGLDVLLGQFEPFASENNGAGEGGFVDLRAAKRALAIPCADDLKAIRRHDGKSLALLSRRSKSAGQYERKKQPEDDSHGPLSRARFSVSNCED